MSEYIVVTVVRDNVVDSTTVFEFEEAEDNAKAEAYFLETCSSVLSNFDEYTSEDIQAILDNGYESFGSGSICISHT